MVEYSQAFLDWLQINYWRFMTDRSEDERLYRFERYQETLNGGLGIRFKFDHGLAILDVKPEMEKAYLMCANVDNAEFQQNAIAMTKAFIRQRLEYERELREKDCEVRRLAAKTRNKVDAQELEREIALLKAKLAAARRLYSQDAQCWDEELNEPLEPSWEVEARFDAEMELAEKRFNDPHPLGARMPNI